MIALWQVSWLAASTPEGLGKGPSHANLHSDSLRRCRLMATAYSCGHSSRLTRCRVSLDSLLIPFIAGKKPKAYVKERVYDSLSTWPNASPTLSRGQEEFVFRVSG